MHGAPAVGDMVKVAVTVRVSVPLVPVTVIVPLPAGAVGAVVTVKVAVAEPSAGGVTEAGLIDPVAPVPAGIDTVSATSELKEFTEPTVTANVVDEPFRTVLELGEIVSEKDSAATMTSVTDVVWFCDPDPPVMLSV